MEVFIIEVLLIGNGINRIANDYSWKSMLEDLKEYCGIGDECEIGNKPFTMVYEELVLRGMAKRTRSEEDIRSYICQQGDKIAPNELHRRIMASDLQNIITTNYDYSLENAYFQSFKSVNALTLLGFTGRAVENKYRLHTVKVSESGEKRIWHIHGEIDNSRTIVLGQAMYSDVLRVILSYVDDYRERKKKDDIDDHYYRAIDHIIINSSPKKQVGSWIDHFFLNNIHILGYGFDYTESDLWWLINLRARYMNHKPLKNKIVFYMGEKNKNLHELLVSHEVEVIGGEEYQSDYFGFYSQALDRIQI